MMATGLGSTMDQPGANQLIQAKVPLEDVDDAFSMRAAGGRIPIVIVPTRLLRIRNDFVLYGCATVLLAIVAGLTFLPAWTLVPGVLAGIGLIVLGVFRSFFVRIPEGTNGLLARGGRYTRTVGSGSHVIPPWIAVSHVVTRREVPFDIPVIEAPTRDTVRVNIDALLTFTIDDPYRFVFAISTDDFDHVLQAACQEAMRSLIRRVTVSEVFNLAGHDTDELREMINPDIASYGVAIQKIKITFAQPPGAFMHTEEERQLAILHLAEQAEKQILALRRQEDADILERQRVRARVQRQQDELQVQQQETEHRRRLVELEAEIEALRLARLDQRLRDFPDAVRFDVSTARLDVARALAGNSRAVLQIGSADDISQVLLVRDLWDEARTAAGQTPLDAFSDATHSNGPAHVPPTQPSTPEAG